jgi:four helix bundle protein
MENGQEGNVTQRQSTLRDFKDLVTWRFARNLRGKAYAICNRFPKAETFALSSQMRRAAISVGANIAEGYGRFSYQQNIQYCRQSRGSVYELRDHLTGALDAGYIAQSEYAEIDALAVSVTKLINGYIRSTRSKKQKAGASG